MRIDSDLTVQNDLVVNNTVTANKLVSTAVGVPKFTSATNIELNAGGAVIIGSSALRIKSFTTTERNALTAATGDVIYNSTLLKLQLRIASAWKTITLSDDVPTNNNQLSNGAGYITSAADIHTFTMTSNGSSAYRFAQDTRYFPLGTEDDPVLYVRRGETYHFINNSGGSHPFQIRVSNGGSAYNTGVTNNGASSGTIVWTVPMTAPSTVYYQCTAHSGMGNTINIVTQDQQHMAEKEYIISLKRNVDYTAFDDEMQAGIGRGLITNRSVDVANSRPLSQRNTHYMLEEAEVTELLKDERVLDLSLIHI